MAKILIVDDSDFSRRLMRSILEKAGHSVVEAADGMSGIEAYALEKPDLVLMDITMPTMTGLETLERMRTLQPTPRVVFATADIQSSIREEALEKGAVGLIYKPFTEEKVLGAVKQALAGSAS